jgi:hypothetical protein
VRGKQSMRRRTGRTSTGAIATGKLTAHALVGVLSDLTFSLAVGHFLPLGPIHHHMSVGSYPQQHP